MTVDADIMEAVEEDEQLEQESEEEEDSGLSDGEVRANRLMLACEDSLYLTVTEHRDYNLRYCY